MGAFSTYDQVFNRIDGKRIAEREHIMGKTTLTGRPVCQVGLIVRDIEKSRAAYARVLGVDVPDIIISGTQAEANTEYRGGPTEARAKLTFFQVGQVSIELIEPFNGPSTWQEFLDEKGEGVHHIAFEVDDAQACTEEMADEGISLVQRGDYEGGSYTYLDAQKSLGLVLELLQND
jgi:catechol 2,3-dioxygenase-like lactoylglutathione lyase family enzyme